MKLYFMILFVCEEGGWKANDITIQPYLTRTRRVLALWFRSQPLCSKSFHQGDAALGTPAYLLVTTLLNLPPSDTPDTPP